MVTWQGFLAGTHISNVFRFTVSNDLERSKEELLIGKILAYFCFILSTLSKLVQLLILPQHSGNFMGECEFESGFPASQCRAVAIVTKWLLLVFVIHLGPRFNKEKGGLYYILRK